MDKKSDKIYITDISSHLNKGIMSSFLVVEKDLREGARDFYIKLKLADNTGSIAGNVWINAKAIDRTFKEGDIIKIKGLVIKYKENYQITVNKVRVLENFEYNLSDYISVTLKDRDQLGREFFEFIDSIKNSDIKRLLLSIFEDKEYYKKFVDAPAGKSWHHNYIGGLIEHTLSVMKICNFAASLYPIDRDILVAGAILHDIGKVEEYEIHTIIDFTDVGRLVGHVCLADRFVCKKAEELDNFPENLLMKLRHLILSHQGEYENASPRLPQTVEAMILNFADNMDAQSTGINQLILSVQNEKAKWTDYNRIHNRYFYLG